MTCGQDSRGDLQRRRGQTVLIFVVASTILLGVLGLTLDGGMLFFEKRRAQAAADAGAVGAVQEMRRGNRNYADDIRPAAINDTALNGFPEAEATITVNNPPLAGGSVGDSDFVEVIVEKEVATYFLRFFGPSASTVGARAVAGLARSGEACVVALDPTASSALRANGNPTLLASCGIFVNSTSGSAIVTNGQAQVSGSYIGVAGGASGNGFTPAPETGMLPLIDPFLNLPTPSSAGTPPGYATNAATSGALAASAVGFAAKGGNGGGNNGGGNGGGNSGGGGGGTTVYWPGYYDREIKIQNGTAVFMPGTYVLEAGMKVTGGTVTGTGVFFYNINSKGNDYVDVGGNANVNLSAPTSGTYKGMLFMGPRNGNSGNPGNKIARGNANSSFQGALYFPSEHLTWGGNPQSSIAWGMVVANTIQIQGTADTQVINPPTEEQAPDAFRMAFFE